MNLCTNLMWWRSARGKPTPRPVVVADWVNATLDPAQPAPEDGVRCCGWFDSSHELQAGAQVTEYLTPDRVANEVPLGWWLDWQVAAGGPSTQAALHLR